MIECKILKHEHELHAIQAEWRDLYKRAARSPFTSYDIVTIWWRTIAQHEQGRKLHVVVAYENGKLVGLLPLTVLKTRGIRVMQMAGFRAYNCGEMIAETTGQAIAMWNAASNSPHYDFADLRDVYPESLAYETLSTFAKKRDLTDTYYLDITWKAGEEWMSTLNSHTRINHRRCIKRMQEQAPVTFEVYSGGALPDGLIDDMVGRKVTWGMEKNKRGLFEQANVAKYFHEVLDATAKDGSLFLSWLKCGDKVVAYNHGLIHNGIHHAILWTHDTEWNKWSPGSVTVTKSIAWSIDQGLKAFNFRQGESQFKRRHSSEKRYCAEFTFSGTLRGRIIEFLYMTVRDLVRLTRPKNKRPVEKGD